DWRASEIAPGPDVRTREELAEYGMRNLISYHHQVGTCKMGIDRLAVTTPDLRVHGVDGLRVADASVMPAVTSGNTNAASVMIGERCADFLCLPGDTHPQALLTRGYTPPQALLTRG